MDHHTKQGLWDALSGLSLISVPLWVHNLEDWLQLVVVLTGAILGIAGIIRLIRNSNNHGDA